VDLLGDAVLGEVSVFDAAVPVLLLVLLVLLVVVVGIDEVDDDFSANSLFNRNFSNLLDI